jgi:hypothetical protein
MASFITVRSIDDSVVECWPATRAALFDSQSMHSAL